MRRRPLDTGLAGMLAALDVSPIDCKLRDYWVARLRQHVKDTYADIRLGKLPEDLRAYEHLIWGSRPNTVIELGTHAGGSSLWFRDRLRTLASYGHIDRVQVISIDIDLEFARRELPKADPSYATEITLLDGDVCDPSLADRVRGLLAPGARCLVVEDSGHTYDTTWAALEHFSPFVAPGDFLVVEDGVCDVEALRTHVDWPRGVLPALHDWLASDRGRAFDSVREAEFYGVTCHPEGFLQRKLDDTTFQPLFGSGGATPSQLSQR
jgi:cephalosporin hydroxylase